MYAIRSYYVIKQAQELFITKEHLVLMHRYAMAKYRFYMVRRDGEYLEEISLSTYLDLKDYYAKKKATDGNHLHIDFMPFYDFSPSVRNIVITSYSIHYTKLYDHRTPPFFWVYTPREVSLFTEEEL